jgi:hypothetical protein
LGRTFKDQAAADLLASILNPDELGEWVTFYPALGHEPPRRIVVVIQETESYEQRDLGEELLGQIEVTCSRDEASNRGGIERPLINDVIHRDSDPENVNYVWSGELLNGTNEFKLVARFNRAKAARGGAMQKESP